MTCKIAFGPAGLDSERYLHTGQRHPNRKTWLQGPRHGTMHVEARGTNGGE